MQNFLHRKREPRFPNAAHHVVAMHDGCPACFEQPAVHGNAVIIELLETGLSASRSLYSRRAGVVFHFLKVGLPIAPDDGGIGNQIVQIELVQNQHARNAERQVININVVGIVADVIEDGIISSGMEFGLKLAPVADAEVALGKMARGLVVLDEDIQAFG